MEYHNPVLLEACVEALNMRPDGVYVDVTFGGGGHSKRMLQMLDDTGRLIAFDQDADALSNADLENPKLTFVAANFRHLKRFLDYHGCVPVDGILADLGVSSHQFDDVDRGFSYRDSSKRLDMRMNVKQQKDAVYVLNQYEESALSDMFYLYGELRNSRVLASAIVKVRGGNKIETVGDLLKVIDGVVKGMSPKFLAQVFQAIRIEVNEEMEALKEMLEASLQVLKPGGRLVVMSYHSLEDRMVKNFVKTGNINGEIIKDKFGNINRPFRLVNKKTTAPGAEEISTNPRARSAKLRVAEKLENK